MPFSFPEVSAPRLDLITILRLLQGLLSLLSLALNASVIDFFNTHTLIGRAPSYLIFLTFTAVFTLLISIPYTTFAPRYFRSFINRYASLVVELLTTIFWFCGFVAGAVWLAQADFCEGLICRNARAGVALSAIVLLCYAITSYFPVKYCFFSDEERSLGEGNWSLGMNGAERITRARMRRDATNNARLEEGEETGGFGKVVGGIRGMKETARVRCGNVLQEWRVKAGRGRNDSNGRAVGPTRQMSERSRSESMV